MSPILVIIAIIILLYIHNRINKKIDEKEEAAMQTPGTAKYIRENFPEIIQSVSSTPGITKDFERDGYIRYINAKTGQLVVLQQWSGKVSVIVIKDNCVAKKWEIGKNDIDALLISEIKNVIGAFSFWESYQDKYPQKASEILKLTKIDIAEESDIAAREIVESIERWSRNVGEPIYKLKHQFIEKTIDIVGEDNLDFLISDRLESERSREAETFGIEEDHTITRFMIDILEEYTQENSI